MQAVYRQAG